MAIGPVARLRRSAKRCPILAHLALRCPDEGVLGVVVVGRSVGQLGRNLATGEHTEVDAPRNHDLRQACLADPQQSARPSVVDAPDHRIGDLVGREVDDADELPRLGQLLHGRPADAVGVEDDGLVAVLGQAIAQSHDRLGGVAEHGHADETTVGTTWFESARIGGHGGHRRGHVVEHRGRHRVQTHDVDHGVHHHHVRSADQGPELVTTGRDRAQQHLWARRSGAPSERRRPSPLPPLRPARLRRRPSHDRTAPSSTTGWRCASWRPPAPGCRPGGPPRSWSPRTRRPRRGLCRERCRGARPGSRRRSPSWYNPAR